MLGMSDHQEYRWLWEDLEDEPEDYAALREAAENVLAVWEKKKTSIAFDSETVAAEQALRDVGGGDAETILALLDERAALLDGRAIAARDAEIKRLVALADSWYEKAAKRGRMCEAARKERDALLDERAALVEALSALIGSFDAWQGDVERVIGRPMAYTGWPELEAARAALRGEEAKP